MTVAAHKRSNVVPFDFRRQSKFTRDHVRALQIVHETFARQLSTVLATTLRAAASCTFSKVEQFSYDEYVRSLPNPSYIIILSLNPLPGAAIFQFPLPITFAAIDRLLGGGGDSLSPKRPLTEIESNLMRSVVDRALRELEYAYETRVGDKRGTSTICIPFTTMQPVLEALASQSLFQDHRAADPELWQRQLERALSMVPIELRVRFDSVALTSQEIIDLQVGDVVPLNHPVDKPLTVSVDEVTCYRAVSGRRGKRLACLIVGTDEELGE